jgi:hypothetical protein
MVVMQDGGDLVTILPCSQISLKNGMFPISTKQKLISCATYQKHIIYGNSIVMISFVTKKKTKTNRPTEIAKFVKLKRKFTSLGFEPKSPHENGVDFCPLCFDSFHINHDLAYLYFIFLPTGLQFLSE